MRVATVLMSLLLIIGALINNKKSETHTDGMPILIIGGTHE
jgi:hypothetical protein